jgi:hypothetical protein
MQRIILDRVKTGRRIADGVQKLARRIPDVFPSMKMNNIGQIARQ